DARRPTQVRRNHSGTPCAMALRLLRALPGVPGFLATIACAACRAEGPHRPSANLTPASGGQDHTAGPYAMRRTSCGTTASIASRLAFGDDRPNAPLAEAGRW